MEALAGHHYTNGTLHQLGLAAQAAIEEADWESEDGQYCLYRLLLGLPWPASLVQETPADVPHPLATSLGALMDAIVKKAHALRDVAYLWLDWATDADLTICRAWADAVTAAADAAPGQEVAASP